MYSSIEIDFEVYKEITARRETPEMTPNDVLRKQFDLDPASPSSGANGRQEENGEPWVWKGVTFPHGTEFRAEYKGRTYYAKAEDGALIYEGKKFKSPSPAARAVTGNSVNGWIFWECRMPHKNNWILIDELKSNTGRAV